MIKRNLEESLVRLKHEIEGDEMAEKESPGLLDKAKVAAEQGIHSVRTLAEAGLIRPERPDRTIRALVQVQRWGFTPAAGYRASAARYPNEDAIIDELGHL